MISKVRTDDTVWRVKVKWIISHAWDTIETEFFSDDELPIIAKYIENNPEYVGVEEIHIRMDVK